MVSPEFVILGLGSEVKRVGEQMMGWSRVRLQRGLVGTGRADV